MLLKIGELAKRTGLTVRTLHHYDDIKLLCPSARSDAGYRLYNRQDIERLHRIQALRRMELSLADIGAMLENDGANLQAVIEQQITQLDHQANRAIELRDRLQVLLARLIQNVEPDMMDWLATLEMMAVYDKYFTSEEVTTLRKIKAQENSPAMSESIKLIARIRGLMDRKVPAASDEAQTLAIPWMTLAHKRMGGDARLIRKLDTMHRNEPAAQVLTGVDGAMIDYMAEAASVFRMTIYAKYLSPEEMQPMREKYSSYGLQWLELAADISAQQEQDGNPCSPDAQALCSRWLGLSAEVWGTDPEVQQKVQRAHRNEPDLLVGTGVNKDMLVFLEQGIAHLRAQAHTHKTEP